MQLSQNIFSLKINMYAYCTSRPPFNFLREVYTSRLHYSTVVIHTALNTTLIKVAMSHWTWKMKYENHLLYCHFIDTEQVHLKKYNRKLLGLFSYVAFIIKWRYRIVSEASGKLHFCCWQPWLSAMNIDVNGYNQVPTWKWSVQF